MATAVINSEVQFENSNQGLIEKCISGDQKAQFKVYKLYYKAMYDASYRIVKDRLEAADILQESFLSAFENINSFSGRDSFDAWLRGIVIKRSVDSLKRVGVRYAV
jgi:RNA polymerase sigma factor (sigma-70 family)